MDSATAGRLRTRNAKRKVAGSLISGAGIGSGTAPRAEVTDGDPAVGLVEEAVEHDGVFGGVRQHRGWRGHLPPELSRANHGGRVEPAVPRAVRDEDVDHGLLLEREPRGRERPED
jgi:hypothetical protein